MEKFIEKNRYKIGLGIALVLLALFGYKTFVSGTSGKVAEKSSVSDTKSLELARQCKADGQKNLQEDIDQATNEKYKSGVADCFYDEPLYLFSKDLNTCLYQGGYTCDLNKINNTGIFKGSPAKRWSKHITDVYTNKSLYDVYVEDSSDIPDWLSKQITDFNGNAERLGF